MAGLLLRELKLRGLCDRILIVCEIDLDHAGNNPPAAARIQHRRRQTADMRRHRQRGLTECGRIWVYGARPTGPLAADFFPPFRVPLYSATAFNNSTTVRRSGINSGNEDKRISRATSTRLFSTST